MLKTSKLSEKIHVFRKEKQRDSSGYLINSFNFLFTLYANLKFNSGSETISAAVISKNNVSIRVRWDEKSEQIKENDIIKWKNKTINILAVLPEMDTRRYIDIVGEIGVINDDNLMG